MEPKKLTTEEINLIAFEVQGATTGPWRILYDIEDDEVTDKHIGIENEAGELIIRDDWGFAQLEDFEAICALRNAAPALLAALTTPTPAPDNIILSPETVAGLRREAAGLLSEEKWQELQVDGDVHDGAIQGRAYLATQLLAAALTPAPATLVAESRGEAGQKWVDAADLPPAGSYQVCPVAFIEPRTGEVKLYGDAYYSWHHKAWMDDTTSDEGPVYCSRKIAYWLDRGPTPALPAALVAPAGTPSHA